VWLNERGDQPAEPLFPTSTGKPLTRKALAGRIAKHATHAAQRCPSLTAKTITPHVYADAIVKPTLGRCCCSEQLGVRDCRHIHRSSRKRSASWGR
jgi:hypothetical protein